jgi:hypothetical protein
VHVLQSFKQTAAAFSMPAWADVSYQLLTSCYMCGCLALQVLDDQDAGEPLVMCVDDDEVNHIVLEGMLQSQNYR